MQSSGQGGNPSLLQDLLSQVPSGLFGGKDQAGKADELQANAAAAQMQNTHITPRQPEAWTRQLQETQRQIYPILEWHDELMKDITEAIEKIPVLPALIEQLQGILSRKSGCYVADITFRPIEYLRFLTTGTLRTSHHQPSQNRTQYWFLRDHPEQ